MGDDRSSRAWQGARAAVEARGGDRGQGDCRELGHTLFLWARRLIRGRPRARSDGVWQADIPYIKTGEGWLYLAGLLDACSRKIVGWAADDAMLTSLVVPAFERAVAQRKPETGLLHHSDRGSHSIASCARKREPPNGSPFLACPKKPWAPSWRSSPARWEPAKSAASCWCSTRRVGTVARELAIPAGIHLFSLPPSTPELSPAEHLWPPIREELANRFFSSLDALEEVLAARCRLLSEEQAFVRSATCFRWWPKQW
jgi:hypothetical protein